MRSCVYCGRTLEKGEVCNCPGSVRYRAAKAEQTKTSDEARSTAGRQTDYSYSGGTEQENTAKTDSGTEQNNASHTGTDSGAERSNSTYAKRDNTGSYHTGYTVKESKLKQAWNRFRAKRQAAKNSGELAKGFFNVLLEGIKAPVSAIEGAHDISVGIMLLLAAVQGAAIWLCAYFIVENVKRGPLAFLASLMSFNGAEGYSAILRAVLTAASGAVSGIILFFLYSGIFFLINKYIFRLKTSYRDFSQRLALAGIPLIIACAIGIFFSRISQVMLMILLLCGAAGWIVLTYEALKTEWYSKTPDKVAYSMLLGLLVFFSIVCRLMTL